MFQIGGFSQLDVSEHLLLFIFVTLVLAISRALYQAYATPLRDVPGPWLAKFTRIWLLHAFNSGSFEKQNILLHRKYGLALPWRCKQVFMLIQDRTDCPNCSQ